MDSSAKKTDIGAGGLECWYPGAQLPHVYQLPKNRIPTSSEVTKVLLSFGINNRKHTSIALLEIMLKRVLGAMEPTFPNAQVYVPMNFNCLLLVKEKMLLRDLNGHINTTEKATDTLPYGQFETETDLTHWTPEMGEVMWQHFKLLRERHPVNQKNGTVVNLPKTRNLNKDEMSLLQKGLSLIPKGAGMVSGHWNKLDAEAGLMAYHRRLKLAVFF